MAKMEIVSQKTLVDDDCIQNKPYQAPEVFLFVTEVTEYRDARGRKVVKKKRDVRVIKGATWEEAWKRVVEFVEQPGCELVMKEATA